MYRFISQCQWGLTNYNITISMPINAYTKCVFALDSNANDGRCREPWKLTACIFISIQITISRDSSIICRRGCCYSFETMSQTNPNAIYDVFSWIEIVFEKFMLHMRMRWLAISIEKKFSRWKRCTKVETVELVLAIFSICSDCIILHQPRVPCGLLAVLLLHCVHAHVCWIWIRELFYILTR